MGWAVIFRAHEHIAFQPYRLGIATCPDKTGFHHFGRWLRRRPHHSKAGRAVATQGKVYGIDYANGSVAASRAKNLPEIRAGRVAIQKASVSQLPFLENKFDLVTAIETQYYWPDPVKDMREILRVMKPDGTLVVIAESYKKGATNALQRPVMKLLKSSNFGVDEHREVFLAAGYTDVQIWENRSRGWICVSGKKPPI